MISSLLIINTINKIFGKHSAETTTLQKYHNSERTLFTQWQTWYHYLCTLTKQERESFERRVLNSKSQTCGSLWLCFLFSCLQLKQHATGFGCPAELQCHHSCSLSTSHCSGGFGMSQLSLLLPCGKESTPQSWKIHSKVSGQTQVSQLQACLQVA